MTDNRRQWHIEKSVSIGHLLTTATLFIAGAIWFAKNESRITTMEANAVFLESRVSSVELRLLRQGDTFALTLEKMRVEQREDYKSLSAQLRELTSLINAKADR